MLPYSLSSDHHAHDYSLFANAEADGVNSRLRIILNELERQAEETKKRGWTKMRLGGDLFHVRGKLTPSVLNPVVATFKRIDAMGIEVDALAGNHDLEGVESNSLGNAMQVLDEIPGFRAITSTLIEGDVVMIPWIQDLDALRDEMRQHAHPKRDLIIHAPVNGVIKGIPDHGLEADELKALGYCNVFAGHYHNRVDFGGGVWSIGATTHQNWSDPGTQAGWLMVQGNGTVTAIDSAAPKFINIDTLAQVDPRVRGNYVRLRLQDEEEDAIKKARGVIEANGALGIVDHSSKKRPNARAAVNVQAGLTLEAAVTSWCREHLTTKLDKDKVATMALDVLRDTGAT